MENEPDFFRLSLHEEFAKREKKNPKYSIRAFAKQLDINSSTLAQILNGKRNLTEAMANRLGEKLRYGPAKMRAIRKGHSYGSTPYKNFSKLKADEFQVISEWYHYAILELTACEFFIPSPIWISKTLGLPLAQTMDAIKRLTRLNYLRITPDGKWIDTLGNVNNLGNEVKAKAYTEHQKQVVSKALEALNKTPYENRVQSSMTLAASKEKLAEAKIMILDFMEELTEFLNVGEAKDEVFNLSVSLYPLSNNEETT